MSVALPATREYNDRETWPGGTVVYLIESWLPSPDESPWDDGEWVPELDRKGWRERGPGCRLRTSWVRQDRPTSTDLTALSQLPLEERLQHLWALGSDIGSIERDGLLYANLFEQLKNAVTGDNEADDGRNNEAADEVVARMRAWGLSSADMPPVVGGPPEPVSPVPWRKLMDWLLSRLRDVGEVLLKLVDVFWALVKDFAGATSISVSVDVGLTPTLGVSFKPGNTAMWEWLKKFLGRVWDELGAAAFAA